MNCKTWGQTPSQRLNVPPLRNDWAAWQFDATVLYVGLTIENAMHERESVGDPKKYETRAKYTLSQLLDDDFRLPRPHTRTAKGKQVGQQVKMLFGMVGQRQEMRKKGKGKANTPSGASPLMQKWLERKRLA